MKQIIFYSWESDLPNSTNRGLIQNTLERAAKSIRDDDSIEIEPVIQRDTAGVPGSPDIGSTIFARIEKADIFVCDVSIINQNTGPRPTPNPNVLLELGFAIKACGFQKIVMVMNTAFGEPEDLPFDLKNRRVTTYYLREGDTDKAVKSKSLEATFEKAIKAILAGDDNLTGKPIEPRPIKDQLMDAISNHAANQDVLARKFMSWFSDEITRMAPDLKTSDDPEAAFSKAIPQTIEIMADFANVAELASEMKANNALLALYKSFGPLLLKYDTPEGFSGTVYEHEFDFFKFIGHEAFVILIAMLIRNERWQLLSFVLNETIFLEKAPYGGSNNVNYLYFFQRLKSLNIAANWSRILKLRRTSATGTKIVSFKEFVNADFFLFLRRFVESQKAQPLPLWFPISLQTAGEFVQLPKYIHESVNVNFAHVICPALGANKIEDLRTGLDLANQYLNKLGNLSSLPNPLYGFDVNAVGTK